MAVTHGLSSGELGCPDEGVEAISDGAVALVAGVEVDQDGAGGVVSHAVHELTQGGSGFRGERVAGVPSVVQVQVRNGSLAACLVPDFVKVASRWTGTFGSEEHVGIGLWSHEFGRVCSDLGIRRAGRLTVRALWALGFPSNLSPVSG
jgi:hypothetical protein